MSGRETIIHSAQQQNINQISKAVLRIPYWLNGNRSSVSQQFVLPQNDETVNVTVARENAHHYSRPLGDQQKETQDVNSSQGLIIDHKMESTEKRQYCSTHS